MADPSELKANWSFPTKIVVGAGTARKVGRACAEAGIARPLVVTDGGLQGMGFIGQLRADLAASGHPSGLFAEVRANPTAANLEAGIAAFKAGGHDGIVAIGGGSALDCGKAIAFMAGQTLPVWTFEDRGDRWKQADADAIAPVVALPTTAGTGSEVGRAAVITNEAEKVKKIIFHPGMLPRTALLDPVLSRDLPPRLTAATGMDALAHCLEAYCAPAFHPMADGIAVEGMRLIQTALPRAHATGDDLEARTMMLSASAMGSVAFQKGLGAIHALSHPLGAAHDLHHGLLNGVLMPYVLAFNRPALRGRMERLAAWLELAGSGFDAVMTWILDLRRELEIPHSLAALDVPADGFKALAERTVRDPTASGNPLPITVESAIRLFEDAHAGTGLPESG